MIRMGVSGRMFLPVPAYPGSPGHRAVKQLHNGLKGWLGVSD